MSAVQIETIDLYVLGGSTLFSLLCNRLAGKSNKHAAAALRRIGLEGLDLREIDESRAKSPAERMARVACTSARHLTRLFTEHAGCTPLDYLHRVRYARARELLMQEGLPIERVAERAGFGSAMQMRRVWRKYEATAPSATASRAVRASAAVDRATASNRAGRTRNAV